MTQMDIAVFQVQLKSQLSPLQLPCCQLPRLSDPPSPSLDENVKVKQGSSELFILDGMAWKFTVPKMLLDLLNWCKQN